MSKTPTQIDRSALILAELRNGPSCVSALASKTNIAWWSVRKILRALKKSGEIEENLSWWQEKKARYWDTDTQDDPFPDIQYSEPRIGRGKPRVYYQIREEKK